MTFRYLILFLCSLCGSLLYTPLSLSAQEEPNCSVIPEAIEKLFTPHIGAFSMWDVIKGSEDQDEIFQDVLAINNKEIILGGGRKTSRGIYPILRYMDRRGLTNWVWEDTDHKGGARHMMIHDVLKRGASVLVAAQLYDDTHKPTAIWFGVFDIASGRKTTEQTLTRPKRSLSYGGISRRADEKGWVIALSETKHLDGGYTPKSYARFILLDEAFKEVSERAFIPGPENKVHDIFRGVDANGRAYYLAAGEIIGGNGRPAALVLRLDDQANIVWIQQFSRGGGSRFNKVIQGVNGNVIALGDARPIDPEAPSAAFLTYLDAASGTPIWQRYISHDDISYNGVGLMASPDGRTHILLAGDVLKEKLNLQDHARLMTLSPRAERMLDLSYTAGQGVVPRALERGTGDEVMIAGSTHILTPAARMKDALDPHQTTADGWMVVAEPFVPYEDPCIIKERKF